MEEKEAIETEGYDPRFKYLLISSGISRFGISAFNLIIIWVLLFETKNAFLAGLGDGMLSLPLFLSFFLGAIIDKTAKKKRIAIAVGLLRAGFISSILYGFMVHSEVLVLLSIYSTSFILGLTSDILNSIRSAWQKEILNSDQYQSGSSLLSIVTYLGEGIGYLLSGILLSLGFTISFEIIALVFLVSVVPVIPISVSYKPEFKSATESIKDGIRYLRKETALIELMVIALIINLVFGMLGIVFISMVQIRLHLPSYYASYVFTGFISGIVIGSGIGGRVKGKIGFISILIFLTSGILITLISTITNIYIILALSIIIGITIGIANVIYNAATLKLVSQEFMARVYGAFSTFGVGATFASGMIGGAIIQLTSVSYTFLILGLFVIMSNVVWLFFKRLYSIVV